MELLAHPEIAIDRPSDAPLVSAGVFPGERPGNEGHRTKMTPASLTTTTESIGFSTASDYYTEGREPQGEPPHAAVSIIWYDQATPIYACPVHEPHVRSLRHAGSEQVANYDEQRADAYRRMFEEGVTCDVCAGMVPEKVDR